MSFRTVAIVLAAAGLKRLDLEHRIRAVFAPSEMLPAAGQGALGIEIRSARPEVQTALAPLVHQGTWLRVAAERAVSRAMGGSCSMPLAAHATIEGGVLKLRAAWGEPEGATELVMANDESPVADLPAAEALGLRVAQALRQAGAH